MRDNRNGTHVRRAIAANVIPTRACAPAKASREVLDGQPCICIREAEDYRWKGKLACLCVTALSLEGV